MGLCQTFDRELNYDTSCFLFTFSLMYWHGAGPGPAAAYRTFNTK